MQSPTIAGSQSEHGGVPPPRWQKVKRAILLTLGWLAAASAFWCASMCFYLRWNALTWAPTWDGAAALGALGSLAVLAGIWFLARVTRDRVSRIVSLLLCLLVVGFAVVFVLPAEPLSEGFLGRGRASPLWFRGGMCL